MGGKRILRKMMAKYWILAAVLLAVGTAAPAQTPVADSSKKPDDPVPADSITKSPSATQRYVPISGTKRVEWFFVRTVGPESLFTGLFTAGIGTARDTPEEYGPHAEGFVKRYGMRFTGVATSNAMEAGLGSLWGEDPRYFRATGRPLSARLLNVMVMTFVARRPDGRKAPAYARYMAITGSNFLSNTWRADSEATTSAAISRTAIGFAAHMADNAFQEFWPSLRKHVDPLSR
jgi:hypothetical protein